MKSIKNILLMSSITLFSVVQSMDDVQKKFTRYIVRSTWVRNNQEVATERVYSNFNDIAAKLLALRGNRLNSNETQYVTLRLQLIKAISSKITTCLIEKLNASGKKQGSKTEIHQNDIEPDYVRNQEPAVDVPQNIQDFVNQFISCGLLTDSNTYAILQPKSISLNHKHYIKEDANLPELNRYLSWVEQLGMAYFLNIPPVTKSQSLDQLISAAKILGLKTSVYQNVKNNIDQFMATKFSTLVGLSAQQFLDSFKDLKSQVVTQDMYLNLLYEIIAYGNPRFHQNIYDIIEKNGELKKRFNETKEGIIGVLKKKFKLNDEFIRNFENSSVASFEKRYSDFVTNYNKLKDSKTLNYSAINALQNHIKNYIALAKPTEGNLTKINELLRLIEALKNKPLPVDQARDLLFSLAVNLYNLKAITR